MAKFDTVQETTEMVYTSIELSGVRPDIYEYGDGRASQKIVHELEVHLTRKGEAVI